MTVRAGHNLTATPARGWRRVIQRLAATRLAGWFLSRWLPTLDQYILRRTDGLQTAATYLTGIPSITLTTYGAKSGQPRQCPLFSIPDGERVILIASNFGSTRHPAWYINLRANPEAILTLNGVDIAYSAREVSDPERQTYWDQAVQFYPGYQAYKHRAGKRKIPILVLTPHLDRERETDDRV
ncbi:MAG: nitroreductase family deazaflavin-dependent oxidoreductase [Anaerolineae bacterium]|nr:nitroreductase family deazaflavin-dependent oxidoreductase [Anaerolineae bacterium]